MKKVFFNNSKDKFNFEEFKGEKTLVILPQESAINFTIRDFLENEIDIRNTEFETFDKIIKKYRKLSSPDSVTKFIVLSRILKNNLSNIKIFPETVDIVLDFFDSMIDNYLGSEEISKFDSKIVSVLEKSFTDYNNYFKSKNQRLSPGIESIVPSEINFDTIIISGFAAFRRSEYKLIEKLMEDKNIYIHMPFNFIKSDLLDETLRNLEDLNFEIIRDEFIDYKESVKNLKVLYSKDNFYNLFFTKVKKILEKNNYSDLKILYSSKKLAKSIKVREDFEGLEFNFKEKENAMLRGEFLKLLDYFENKNKKNSIARLRLKYFSVNTNILSAEKTMLATDFLHLDEIDFSKMTEADGEKTDFDNFYDAVNFMQSEKLKESESIDYYSNFFINYIEFASEKIESEVKLNPDSTFLRDFIYKDKLIQILDNMKSLKPFYKEISLSEYILLLRKYIEESSTQRVTNLEAIELSDLKANYYRRFKNLILIGLDNNFEKSSKNNFIYNRDTEEFMTEIGIIKDEFEIDYITLVYAILNSENTLILTEDEEKGYSKVLNTLINKLNFKACEFIKEYNTSDLDIDFNRDENNYNLRGNNYENIREKIKDRYYSVTDFDILKDCPRRFIFERVYKLEELAKEYDEKFYLKMGDRYHNILEKYFKLEKEFSEKTLKNLILKEIGEGRNYSELDFFEKIDCQNTYEILKDYIQADLEEQKKDNLYPSAFEEGFKMDLNGVKIVGRIDRIDSNQQGEGLVDYKRSSVKTKKEITDLKSFQMPIYAISRVAKGKKFAKASYGSIKRGEISTVIKNQDILAKNDQKKSYMSDGEIKNLLREFTVEINRLVSEVESGNFESESDCKYCNYTDICKNLKGGRNEQEGA
ncbi:PD-(D/E)XK nuclease family protein [Peptoniphilus sp. MSJ-1]|uniref:PD-(D/E)XK nuclease family protein n=1 Tax=Peptoniphilus ovalis TaxID=2841503 RepID=A0ABS6FFE2_9FIRM|nr:PD-(D/E)XK nuclease family protein [Peptoniphilus ovalis]MBU5668252.1 PD-(D/E)XK nuclease family protein [Peptoniphilus ovalis]